MSKWGDHFTYHLGHCHADMRYLNPTAVGGGVLMVLRLIPQTAAGLLVGSAVMGARGYYHGGHAFHALDAHLAYLHHRYQRQGPVPQREEWFGKISKLHTALYPQQPSMMETLRNRTATLLAQPQRG